MLVTGSVVFFDWMKTDEIRQKYLDFFVSKGHQLCASDVLVPTWDRSVLFTPAGMNPFKDHFLGNVELEFNRATSCQKCLRTGDIENVGRTAYHHTFFEMLGNFSFGDYFKREAIVWAWEFLTDKQWLGVDPEKLTATVFTNDEEAFRIWQTDIGLSNDRIQRLDEYENFWPAGAPTDGPDGVCGPCSEIFYHADGIGRSNEVEIWNLVFTQFNRSGDPPDNLHPLPHRNIDTGMGLERIAAVMQGVDTNFHIDILRPIVEAGAEITGMAYQADSDSGRFLRRIADHVRACTFAIHENVYPGPSKAEYVIRRLLRRCTLEARQLGKQDPFLYRMVPAVVQAMQHPYPELADSSERIQQVIQSEEEKFLRTLDQGLDRIERIFDEMQSGHRTQVDGGEAADLYQTYGIPPELVESIAHDRHCEFDWAGFQAAMAEHGEKSGKIADTVMGDFGPIDEIKKEVKSTRFTGYETCESSCLVVGLVEAEQRLESLTQSTHPDQILILDRTPFYAESGGQVADTGTVVGPCGVFLVDDVQKDGGVYVHHGHVKEGTIRQGDQVSAVVDTDRRNAIRRAHTATHILHHALQSILGSHAQQRGSKVTDDWLRFDFSNLQAVTMQELAEIEEIARQRIAAASTVNAEILPLADARSRGAMMLFGEKYPDPVRMISIGEFSRELCGGTHLDNTVEVGGFEIIAEESVSSGTRRIEALTGIRAQENQRLTEDAMARLRDLLNAGEANLVAAFDELLDRIKNLKKQLAAGKKVELKSKSWSDGSSLDYDGRREALRTLARTLNVPVSEVVNRIQALLDEAQSLQQQVDQLSDAPQVDAADLLSAAEDIQGIAVIVRDLPMSNPNLMRQLIDQVRKQGSPTAVFLATAQATNKVLLVAGVSRELVDQGIRAGDWVKEIAPLVGGGGGGKPDLAQAGGKQPENIPQALQAARDYLHARLTAHPA